MSVEKKGPEHTANITKIWVSQRGVRKIGNKPEISNQKPKSPQKIGKLCLKFHKRWSEKIPTKKSEKLAINQRF